MNILFLDMDGVVNSAETFKRINEDETFFKQCLEGRQIPWIINPELRERINEILRECSDCKVVWTSTWRMGLRSSKVLIEGHFNTCGFEKDVFVGFTPITHSSHRFMEILEWLNLFGEKLNVEKCVIIDDDSDADIPKNAGTASKKIADKFNIKFFQTQNEFGITEEIKNNIKMFLNGN